LLEHKLKKLKLIKCRNDKQYLLLLLAWILDSKSEHNLKNIPLYLFIKEFLNIEIMPFEIKAKIYFNKILKILFLNKQIFVDIENENILVNNKKFSKNKLSNFIKQIYKITSGYQGKKIIRIVYNELLFFDDIIFDKSYQSIQGRVNSKKSDKHVLDLLLETKEIVNYKELSLLYQKKQVSYGSIFNKHSFDIFGYKLNRYLDIKPDIISIGSSRSHFFKQNFFSKKFYNCSYTMTYLQEGKLFLETILQKHKPKFVILCMEFWWFHPTHYNEGAFLPLHNEYYHFDIDYINKIFEYHYLNYLDLNNFNVNHYNNYTKFYNIGIRAMTNSEGYLNDGYYLYAKAIFEGKNIPYRQKKLCLDYIKNNIFHFQKSEFFDENKLNLFLEIINLLKENDIDFVMIMPPMQKKVFKRLNKIDYSYIKKLDKYFQKFDNYFNMLNPKKLHSNDCEFYDCYHGGDITYMKILKFIQNYKNLKSFLNTDFIEKNIKEKAIVIKDKFYLKEEIKYADCN